MFWAPKKCTVGGLFGISCFVSLLKLMNFFRQEDHIIKLRYNFRGVTNKKYITWIVHYTWLCLSTERLIGHSAEFHRLCPCHHQALPLAANIRVQQDVWVMHGDAVSHSQTLRMFPFRTLNRMLLSTQFGPGTKPTKADRTWPFKPSMIQSRSIARPRKPPCLGWPWVVGTLLTSGLFWGGNDVMVVSSWFLLCSFVFFCSGLSFWNAMIIAVVELLLSYWNVLTVDKNIGCLEDVPIFQTNVISKWWICNCYQLNTIESSVHVVSSRNKVPNTWFLLFFTLSMIKGINL